MESIDEFKAPQYFDFCSLIENFEERNEESSYFELVNNNMPVTDENAFHLSGKRSSVLCLEQDISSSSLIKHVFSDAFETLMLQSTGNRVLGENELTINKEKSPTDEAYLYSVKSIPKTPKKGNLALVPNENKKIHVTKEVSTYVGIPSTKSQNRITIVKPFSFEARDEEMLRRKQERLLKVKGEECKKFTPFHARPVPSFILSSNQNRLNIKSNASSRPISPQGENSKKNSKDTVPGEEKVFKARFPSVLYKEPFTPTKRKKSQSKIPKLSPANNEKASKK